MKKLIVLGAIGLMLAACSSDKGEVTIKLPKDFGDKILVVNHATIENLVTAKQADDVILISDTLTVENGEAKLHLDPAGAAWYNIIPPVMTRMQPEFFAEPDDHLMVNIEQFDPLVFDVKGSQLMEDLSKKEEITRPIQQEYMDLISMEDSVPVEQARAALDKYDAAVKKFIEDNPESPAVPMILTELSGDDFNHYYQTLTPAARRSILMPYADLYYKDVKQMLDERAAEESRKAEVASGTIDAPNFTLPDLSGKKVSLSDFRGKWVVLDFWGSWCGWCIKGFPALKEAYEKYGDKLVVIGIDCNESEAEWREGVKKHKIPWLNVYNGNDKSLYAAYNIEGFPTKAIISPEGKLVDLTTGEDPSFYTRLATFVK